MTAAPARVSVHSALWAREWGRDLASLIGRAASLGFGGVELSLLGIDGAAAGALAATARDAGVQVKCTTGLGPAQDVSSSDAAVRRAGVEYLREAADVVAALGADLLAGVIYAPWGTFGSPASRTDRLRWSAESLAAVAPDFDERGVTLGVEAINRFETDLVNTACQAVELVDLVGAPNVGVHLDTFHMNIEERDVPGSVLTAGSRLVHVHVSGSDRGRPVAGRFPWDPFAAALDAVGYRGWVGVEMFVQADLPVSADLRIWRPIEDSPDEAATAARDFVLERLAGVVA